MCFHPIGNANRYAYSCSFTLYISYTNDMLGKRGGGETVKMLKNKLLLKLISHYFCTNVVIIHLPEQVGPGNMCVHVSHLEA